MRAEHRDFAAFLLLGVGTQWMVNDAVYQNMDVFTAVLPEGIRLPNTAGSLSGALGPIFALSLWAVVCSTGLSLEKYLAANWILAVYPPLVAFVVACAWRAVVGDTSIVIWAALFLTNAGGQASYFVQVPMLARYFSETSVSATMTGSGIGSMVAGGLGLIQAGTSSFSPMWVMLCVTFISASSTVAWYLIVSRGWGRIRLPEEGGGKKSTTESTLLVSETEQRLWQPVMVACLLMGALLNITTWGISFLPYASLGASCTCDPSDHIAQRNYDLATSLAYVAMPIGGFLSYVLPVYDVRFHAFLVSLHSFAYLLQTFAVVGVSFMNCSAGARVTVVLGNMVLRGVFQYVITMQYRVINRLFEHSTITRGRANALYGQLTSWVSILTSFIAYGLAEGQVVGCPSAPFSPSPFGIAANHSR
ncbi:hypothetical protein AB1Y20_012204 [Prymnesium parvum]|uniref:Uncharacterized protein n=1 Tax=Prymnesium parvum TaxID=97485 RepID=A0AB34IQ93_PRYPA